MSQLLALIVSLAVEMPIVRLVVGWREDEVEPPGIWAVAGAATLLTHPFAWMGALELIPRMDYAAVVVVVELAVIAVESLLFRFLARWAWSTALLAAVVANTASVTLGLWLGG